MDVYDQVPEEWSPPTSGQLGWMRRVMSPWLWYTSPVFLEAERVPQGRPVMFIGNHSLLGMLDTPVLMLGIYEHTGHYPRSMGDHFHFTVPGWRDFLIQFGAVHGTRDNCRALMGQGQSIIIFPGGGREVFKRKGELYQLIWKKRTGFARLALEYGYPIVPVAAVGAEECYKILLDQNDLMKTPLGPMLEKKAPRSDVLFPTVVRGLGGTFFPRPQRFYFSFGEPIESLPYQQGEDEEEAIWALREEVRQILQAQINELLRRREEDPERELTARLWKTVR